MLFSLWWIMDYKQLIEIAFEMRENAYAPYSGFKSGAALLTADGDVFTGCNIEVASFTPSVCAGHSAFINAISNGVKNFKALAIIGGADDSDEFDYCPPSGVCRQVIQEFCNPEEFVVILARNINDFAVYTFEDIFPIAFSKKTLIG
jgi:cytidine deaminase